MAPGALAGRIEQGGSGLLDAVGGLGPQRLLALAVLGLLGCEHGRGGGESDDDELLHGGPFRLLARADSTKGAGADRSGPRVTRMGDIAVFFPIRGTADVTL